MKFKTLPVQMWSTDLLIKREAAAKPIIENLTANNVGFDLIMALVYDRFEVASGIAQSVVNQLTDEQSSRVEACIEACSADVARKH